MTDQSGKAVAGADVVITPLAGGANVITKTDSLGQYRCVVRGETDEHVISVLAKGFASARRRVGASVVSGGTREIVADFWLSTNTSLLDTVRVATARRPRLGGGPGIGAGVQGIERSDLSSLDPTGDLTDALSSMPGVTRLPGGGFSVFGGDASDNAILLGGMTFSGGALPRDLMAGVSLNTTPADASRSGFSGALASISVDGPLAWAGQLRATIDAPSLQWAAPYGGGISNHYANAQVSGSVMNRLRGGGSYAAYFQAGRRNSRSVAFAEADAATFRSLGISSDSAVELLRIAGVKGFPAPSLVSDQRNGSFFGTLTGTRGIRRFTGQLSASLDSRAGDGATPTSASSAATGSHSTSLWMNGTMSQYVHGSFFSVTRLAVGGQETSGERQTSLPAVEVQLVSPLVDSAASIRNILLGGSPSLPSTLQRKNVEFRQELGWVSISARQQFQLTAGGRFESYAQTGRSNDIGTYTFTSLDDFRWDRPSTFRRTLGYRTSSTRFARVDASGTEGISLSPNVSLTLGLAAEGSTFLDRPSYNPAIHELFGMRTDRIPQSLGLSPRMGLTWRYGDRPERLKTREGHETRRTFTLSAGEYRSSLSPVLAQRSQLRTGLPSALTELFCIGQSVPAIYWHHILDESGATPTQCVDGTTGSSQTAPVPTVFGFASEYEPVRSRRIVASWREPLTRSMSATLSATRSVTLGRQSAVDVNFSGKPWFSLGEEGGRPVFVSPSSIDRESGIAAATDSRVSSSFGPVYRLQSDLSSDVTAVFAGLTGTWNVPIDLQFAASYSFLAARERGRGFDGFATAGDPRDVEVRRSATDGQHQLNADALWSTRSFRILARGKLASGLRYTPRVAGDINGDGLSNDRAFVFDPRTTPDAGIARGMSELLSRAGSASGCLRSQLGRIAQANSCRGPWESRLDLRAEVLGSSVGWLPTRAKVAFSLSNALAAADVLVHGTARAHGWGQPSPAADPVLLTVAGFDPSRSGFRYSVNPGFGQVQSQAVGLWAPFRLTLDMTIDLSHDRRQQKLIRILYVRPGSDQRRTRQELEANLAGSSPGGVRLLLSRADSLALTPIQRDSLQQLNAAAISRSQKLWAPIIEHLSQLGSEFDSRDVIKRFERTTADQARLEWDIVSAAWAVLSSTQQQQIPGYLRFWFDRRYINARF